MQNDNRFLTGGTPDFPRSTQPPPGDTIAAPVYDRHGNLPRLCAAPRTAFIRIANADAGL
jgi:hypothetical protein